MKAADARTVLARTVETLHRHVPPGHSRTRLLRWLHELSATLVSPASLCTNEELFDAVLCADVEPGQPGLLDELLEQVTTTDLVAYTSARMAADTERSRRVREDLDLQEGT